MKLTMVDLLWFMVFFLSFFWFGGILGSTSRAKFPVSLSNHVGSTPRLPYSSTHHSPESFTHLKLKLNLNLFWLCKLAL